MPPMRTRESRERVFWDAHAASFDDALREYEAGPDPNTAAMLEAVEPVSGANVLDFACGSGLVSAWLAERGATVTAIDLSPVSTGRTLELCDAVGVTVKTVTGDVTTLALANATYHR